MPDLKSTIEERLKERNVELIPFKNFIESLSKNEGPDENKVSDFIVNIICKVNGSINRPAVELLLDELAIVNSNIMELDYHDKTKDLKIERETGKIDIVITIGDSDIIFIENKILAEDQHKQLKRYKDRTHTACYI